MDETEMLKLFYTMHFGDGTVKKAKKISNNSLYLEMFNEPDLVFTYESNLLILLGLLRIFFD